jgi:uncharacterized protein YbjT (DUF2867 family)
MTVLVTGATGNVGSAVVAALAARGEPVRAFVRDPGARLGEHAELALGDFADPSSLRRALDGVDRVFLASGDGPAKVAHECAVIDAAAACGVRLLAKASAAGADAASPLPGAAYNGRIEEHLRGSGIPWVTLRAGFFMTNLLASAGEVRATGRLMAPAGTGRVAMIDPRDVGAVGAAVLTSDGHERRVYELTGPEAIGYAEVAHALSAAVGRSIEYVDVPPGAPPELPRWLATQLDLVFERIRQGALEHVTDTVRVLTGADPRGIARFAHDNAARFGRVAAA